MPRLPNSEIFEAFAKIATEQGLVKQAAEKESKELKEYRDATYPRVGSDTVSVIEALYGVKPNHLESIEYEHNIAEDAHPNQVVIGPSYDKINALIENINERQRIMINITQKPSNGNVFKKRYAEFMNELVKVGNDLDNRNMSDLRVLADTCLSQASELNKVAFPWLIAGVAAAVLGAAYLFNHLNDSDNGLLKNVENTIQQIDDLIGEDWFHSTFYATLKPEFLANLKKFKTDLLQLKQGAEEFNSIEADMHSLKTLNELVNTAKQSGAEIIAKAEEFRHLLQNLAPEIDAAIEMFSNANVHSLAIKNETWLSSLTSKIEPLIHGNWGLFSDRFDDIKHALIPLKASIKSTVEEINNIDNMHQTRVEQIQHGMQEAKEYSPKKTVETPKFEQAGLNDKLNEYEGQINELLGGK